MDREQLQKELDAKREAIRTLSGLIEQLKSGNVVEVAYVMGKMAAMSHMEAEELEKVLGESVNSRCPLDSSPLPLSEGEDPPKEQIPDRRTVNVKDESTR